MKYMRECCGLKPLHDASLLVTLLKRRLPLRWWA